MHVANVATRPTVELHFIDLRIDSDTYARYRSYLQPSELQRADRFMFEPLRHHFVAAHGALRCILASVLQAAPQALRFGQGEHGKPFLLGEESLDFNLSHSGERALLALHRRQEESEFPLGIDIEELRPGTDFAGISRRFLAPAEREQLPESTDPAFAAAFLQIWTRKEAVTKCLGTGLRTPLTAFITADREPVSWLNETPASALFVQNVALTESYRAALCTPEPVNLAYCWSRKASASASCSCAATSF